MTKVQITFDPMKQIDHAIVDAFLFPINAIFSRLADKLNSPDEQNTTTFEGTRTLIELRDEFMLHCQYEEKKKKQLKAIIDFIIIKVDCDSHVYRPLIQWWVEELAKKLESGEWPKRDKKATYARFWKEVLEDAVQSEG